MKLYLALSGDNGLFMYCCAKDKLRSEGPRDDLSYVWGHQAASTYLPEPAGPYYEDPFKLLFGSKCSTISWLSGPRDFDRPISFVTLPGGILKDNDIVHPQLAPVYELKHPDLPALYALGVYDYNETLGVAIFGNAFGELSLFNLAGLDIRKIEGCFVPAVASAAHNVGVDLLRTVSHPAYDHLTVLIICLPVP